MDFLTLMKDEDATGIVAEEHWAKRGAVDLCLWRKYSPAAQATHPGRPVLVFVHGSSFSARTTYDLSVDGVGYSTSGGFVDDIVEQLDELKQQIIDGEISVPTAP